MNPLKRFRYWIAKPLLDQLADIHTQDLVNHNKAAYEHGLNIGIAIGQLQGQQKLLSQLSEYLEQRHSEDPPNQDDIARAKQGMIH